MTKDTKPQRGVSKSNVTASATAATRRQTSSSASDERRLDASASNPVSAPAVSARYIDSRLKQFCLR
jgi:hypothetical protein